MRYTMVVEKAGRNFSAYVPDLPGVVATGSTRAATVRRLGEAVALHLQGILEDGETIPRPAATTTTVDVRVYRRAGREHRSGRQAAPTVATRVEASPA